MHARLIERHAAAIGRMGVIAALMLAAGCDEEPPQEPDEFAVRGSAAGLLVPVALELRIDDDTELLSVTQDGAFAFDARLESGASYTVRLVDPSLPCALRNETGVIGGADAAIELTCPGASLNSLVVSGVAPAVTLALGTTDYTIDLPLSQPAVTLTATVATDGDTLTIAGAPVASGAPSAEIALGLGDNPVDIVVENDLGWQRTYRVNLRRAAQLAQYTYGKASNTGDSDQFGISVALSGDTLAVGAWQEASAAEGVNGDQSDDSAPSSGAVYVFRRSGITWQQEAYLKASNVAPGDNFGVSVALSGDTLAVGSFDEASGTGGSGAVYVFQRSGTTWLEEAYLKASMPQTVAEFGGSVALSGDTLAVGAPSERDDAGHAGAVYVFRRSGTAWELEAHFPGPMAIRSQFGGDVALSGDTLAVGALGEAEERGAVHVFRRTGTDWQPETTLEASNAGAGDYFGVSVALSGDTLAVGASGEDSAATGVGGNQSDDSAEDSGAVYVFRRADAAWQQEAYVKASNTGSDDGFGQRVELSGDTLAVGVPFENSAAKGVGGDQDDDSTENSGAVYVFRRADTAWQQDAYVKASNTGAGDRFGDSVALSGDTLVVGAEFEDSAAQGVDGDQDDESANNSGAIYVFH